MHLTLSVLDQIFWEFSDALWNYFVSEHRKICQISDEHHSLLKLSDSVSSHDGVLWICWMTPDVHAWPQSSPRRDRQCWCMHYQQARIKPVKTKGHPSLTVWLLLFIYGRPAICAHITVTEKRTICNVFTLFIKPYNTCNILCGNGMSAFVSSQWGNWAHFNLKWID